MNQPPSLQKISVKKLGFSQPTLARLNIAGIRIISDIVKNEERITCEQVTATAPSKAGVRSIYALPLLSNMLSYLSRHVKTIPELLQLDPNGRLFWGYEGTRVYATVALIDLGYSEKDGPFLSKENFADFIRNLKAYRFVEGLARREKLSDEFKLWFNDAIKGRVYNADNRPTRKTTVQPFVIK